MSSLINSLCFVNSPWRLNSSPQHRLDFKTQHLNVKFSVKVMNFSDFKHISANTEVGRHVFSILFGHLFDEASRPPFFPLIQFQVLLVRSHNSAQSSTDKMYDGSLLGPCCPLAQCETLFFQIRILYYSSARGRIFLFFCQLQAENIALNIFWWIVFKTV